MAEAWRGTGVAVVGCGHWGRNLARNFAGLGALAAVVDPEPAAAEAQGKAHGVPAMTFDAALSADGVHAVAIAAPAERHAEIAVAASRAGRHVFVEKPIALSRADGEAMRDAARDAGRTLMVGHLLQYHPAFLALWEQVAGGAIGKPLQATSIRLSMGRLRTEEDVLWSFAPHDVSMLLALAGEPPSRIGATGRALVSHDLADEARLELAFPSGFTAHAHLSWLSPFKRQQLVVTGETGSIVLDDTEPWERKLVVTSHAVVDGPALRKGAPEPVALEAAEPLRAECMHFLECCAGLHPPRTDADEALRVLDVLVAASDAMDLR